MKIKPNSYYKRIFWGGHELYGKYSINYTNDTHLYICFIVNKNSKKLTPPTDCFNKCWGAIRDFNNVPQTYCNVVELSETEFLAEML